MKVKDCMCDKVNCVKPETSVQDCAKMMCEHHVGCTPVCDCNNNLVGIVTDRDILLRAVACDKDTCKTPVSEIMTCNTFSCNCNSDVSEAQKIMAEKQVRRIPVVDNGKVVGILTIGDLAANDQINNNQFGNTMGCICGSNKHNAE